MEVLKDRYSITELSERLKVTDHALRYYEKEFNMLVPKDERGRRYYTPELANIMYQIKNMRDEGLEIKAIKKVLISENIIKELPQVIIDSNTTSIVPVSPEHSVSSAEVNRYLDEVKNQIAACVSAEVNSAKEHMTREINKSKLELGACVENSVRKLETKMERHFMEVDRSLGDWRKKNKQGRIKRFFNKFFN